MNSFDLVVIGSGIIGATVCAQVRAREPGARILVIDAGPVVGAVPGAHLRPRTASTRYAAAYRRHARESWGRAAQPDTGRTAGLVNAALFGHESQEFPGATLSWNVGGMASHWTGACPAPDGPEVPELYPVPAWWSLLRQAERIFRLRTSHSTGGGSLAR